MLTLYLGYEVYHSRELQFIKAPGDLQHGPKSHTHGRFHFAPPPEKRPLQPGSNLRPRAQQHNVLATKPPGQVFYRTAKTGLNHLKKLRKGTQKLAMGNAKSMVACISFGAACPNSALRCWRSPSTM